MNAKAQMQDWIDKSKALEKELSKLEKAAQKLVEHDETIRAERESLRREIDEHKEAIRALEQEDSDLKNELLEAMLSDEVAQERSLKQRRKQIATEVEQHKTGIRELGDALDDLEDTEQEAATIAARLDMMNFGYAFRFGNRLRDALVQNELQLKGRQGAVKRELPTYSQNVYREVRAELDGEYAAKQERGGMSEVEYANFQKRKAEQERKEEAANTPFVGVSAHGGPRRSEPSEQDFSS